MRAWSLKRLWISLQIGNFLFPNLFWDVLSAGAESRRPGCAGTRNDCGELCGRRHHPAGRRAVAARGLHAGQKALRGTSALYSDQRPSGRTRGRFPGSSTNPNRHLVDFAWTLPFLFGASLGRHLGRPVGRTTRAGACAQSPCGNRPYDCMFAFLPAGHSFLAVQLLRDGDVIRFSLLASFVCVLRLAASGMTQFRQQKDRRKPFAVRAWQWIPPPMAWH